MSYPLNSSYIGTNRIASPARNGTGRSLSVGRTTLASERVPSGYPLSATSHLGTYASSSNAALLNAKSPHASYTPSFTSTQTRDALQSLRGGTACPSPLRPETTAAHLSPQRHVDSTAPLMSGLRAPISPPRSTSLSNYNSANLNGTSPALSSAYVPLLRGAGVSSSSPFRPSASSSYGGGGVGSGLRRSVLLSGYPPRTVTTNTSSVLQSFNPSDAHLSLSANLSGRLGTGAPYHYHPQHATRDATTSSHQLTVPLAEYEHLKTLLGEEKLRSSMLQKENAALIGYLTNAKAAIANEARRAQESLAREQRNSNTSMPMMNTNSGTLHSLSREAGMAAEIASLQQRLRELTDLRIQNDTLTMKLEEMEREKEAEARDNEAELTDLRIQCDAARKRLDEVERMHGGRLDQQQQQASGGAGADECVGEATNGAGNAPSPVTYVQPPQWHAFADNASSSARPTESGTTEPTTKPDYGVPPPQPLMQNFASYTSFQQPVGAGENIHNTAGNDATSQIQALQRTVAQQEEYIRELEASAIERRNEERRLREALEAKEKDMEDELADLRIQKDTLQRRLETMERTVEEVNRSKQGGPTDNSLLPPSTQVQANDGTELESLRHRVEQQAAYIRELEANRIDEQAAQIRVGSDAEVPSATAAADRARFESMLSAATAAERQSQAALIAELQRECGAAQRKLDQLEQQYVARPPLQDRSGEVERMADLLGHANTRIEKQAGYIRKLEADAIEFNTEIDNLKEQALEKNSISGSQSDQMASVSLRYENAITDLKYELHYAKQKIATLEAEAVTATAVPQQQQQFDNSAELSTEVASLKTQSSAKDDEIRKLTNFISEKDAAIATREEKITLLEGAAKAKETECAEEVKRREAGFASQANELQQGLVVARLEISRLTAELNKAREEATRRAMEIASTEQQPSTIVHSNATNAAGEAVGSANNIMAFSSSSSAAGDELVTTLREELAQSKVKEETLYQTLARLQKDYEQLLSEKQQRCEPRAQQEGEPQTESAEYPNVASSDEPVPVVEIVADDVGNKDDDAAAEEEDPPFLNRGEGPVPMFIPTAFGRGPPFARLRTPFDDILRRDEAVFNPLKSPFVEELDDDAEQ